MRPEVRVRLLRVALAFLKSLDVPDLKVRDIVLTGSNAAYHYKPDSDVDVHLIVDYDDLSCPDLGAVAFDAKRRLFNDGHEIDIRGFPVEVYVENATEPAVSSGVYSILKGAWIAEPIRVMPQVDRVRVEQIAGKLAREIELTIERADHIVDFDRMIDKLRTMRRRGLAAGGEGSLGNLVFKALRSMGYIGLLMAAKTEFMDRDLSL